MAAPLSVRLASLNLGCYRQFLNCSYLMTNSVSQQYSTSSSYKPLKRINSKRTQAQISRALRPKQNFLHFELVDKHRKSVLQQGTQNVPVETEVTAPRDFRHVMPEFMPRPDWKYRDHVFEKLERQDMLKRRRVVDVPEFYVGSIMAVTVSDPYSPDKKNRFVGICIDRGGYGLRAFFLLRNVVDGLGVEVKYEIYDPVVHSVEVLKLEKRLDDQLYYLRNAPLEYSTFSFDTEPVPLPRGSEVPVNTTKVPLNPKPWEMRWERMDLKGIVPLELTEKQIKGIKKSATPWEKNDIMIDYRSKTSEEEEEAVMAEVYREKKSIDSVHRSSKAILKKRKK